MKKLVLEMPLVWAVMNLGLRVVNLQSVAPGLGPMKLRASRCSLGAFEDWMQWMDGAALDEWRGTGDDVAAGALRRFASGHGYDLRRMWQTMDRQMAGVEIRVMLVECMPPEVVCASAWRRPGFYGWVFEKHEMPVVTSPQGSGR